MATSSRELSSGGNEKVIGMEFHQRVLNRAFEYLVLKLDPLPLVQVFEERKYLPSSDIKDIQKLTTIHMKNRKILIKVSELGVNGYEPFKQYLRRSNQDDLVEYLEQKEMELLGSSAPKGIREEHQQTRQQIEEQELGIREEHQQTCQQIAELELGIREEHQQTRQQIEEQELEIREEHQQTRQQIEELELENRAEHELTREYVHNMIKKEVEAASSASFSSMGSFNRDQTILIRKCCHDGQLVTLNSDHVEEIKKSCDVKDIITTGGFGTVYITREPVKGYQIKVVLKEIKVKDVEKMHSITNEKLASRIMHFAIVPLLAYQEDTANRMYHFVSPYLEGGDLFQAIQQHNSGTIAINKEDRLRILFQIACGIEYLHTKVDEFRNAVVHMDIKTPNIVLDGRNNARLIDFGLAREMSLKTDNDTSSTTTIIPQTPGYFPVTDYKSLTPKHDCYNFGVVIRELLTGCKPAEEDKSGCMLREWTEEQVKNKAVEKKLWTESTAMKLFDLSVDCFNLDEQPVNSTSVKDRLEKCTRDIPHVVKWSPDQRTDMCEMCMVNPKVEETFKMSHEQRCECPIQVCVACMRNSYLNPIMCHSCEKKIVPPIGTDWAALMIAGNDTEPAAAEMFLKDITELEEVFVSKSLPVMCLKEEMVQLVRPEKHGEDDSSELLVRVDTAIKKLMEKKPKVLIFVYSGHHSKAGFRLGPEDTEKTNLKDDDLCDRLLKFKETVKKYIVFEDCCKSTTFTKLNTETGSPFWQLNACGSDGESYVRTTTGSAFMKYLIQAFTREALQNICYNEEQFKTKCDKCQIDGEFITANKLLKYVSDHVKVYTSHKHVSDDFEPHFNTLGVKDGDLLVAYKYDFVVELKLALAWKPEDQKISLTLKPKKDYTTFASLKRLLFKKLSDAKGFSNTDHEKLTSYDGAVCIEVSMGPKQKHRQEITTLEKLNAAWIAKRELVVSCRRIENLFQGKVLFSLPDSKSVWTCLHEDTSLQRVETDQTNAPIQKIRIPKDRFRDVRNRLKNHSQQDNENSFDVVLDRLHRDLNKQVKGSWTVLVSFPLDQFFCLELERESNGEG